MPPSFLRYTWLLILGVIVINLAIGHVRSRALVASGRITQDERQAFVRGAALFWTLYCLAQWGLQAASGYLDPLCLHAFPPHRPLGWAAWLLALAGVLFLLKWLWDDENADLLARLGPAYVRGPLWREFTAQRVRTVLAIVLIAAFGGGTLVRVLMPDKTATCLAPGLPPN